MFIFHVTLSFSKKIELQTKYGCIQGKTLLKRPNVVRFLGVPFVLPPVKKIEIYATKEINKKLLWKKKCSKAKKRADACFSIDKLKGLPGFDDFHAKPKDKSEDCLQLNMWIPYNRTGAVLVYMFEGSDNSGSFSLPLYNGSVLADLTGAIVINFNYRLSPLGFGRF